MFHAVVVQQSVAHKVRVSGRHDEMNRAGQLVGGKLKLDVLDKKEVVEGERALFGRKSPGANKRAELGIVLDEPHKSWAHDLAVQKTAIVITSMPSLTVAVAMLKEREQTLMIVKGKTLTFHERPNRTELDGTVRPRVLAAQVAQLAGVQTLALGITSLEVIACNDELEGFKPPGFS
jgi:hypothetical protein